MQRDGTDSSSAGFVRLRHHQLVVDFLLDRQHLGRAAGDIFALTTDELLAAGHPPSLAAALGTDQLATLPHSYDAHQLSPATHKLTCSLHRVALCGQTLRGGELTLHAPPPSDGEYVLLLSDGHLLLHQHSEPTQLTLHLVSPTLHCHRVSHTIDLSRFVRPGELCMVRSRAPLTVKFGPATQCALWTRGVCRLNLRGAERLAFWCDSDARYHPLAWRMDSSQVANRRQFLTLWRQQAPVSASERATAYRRLFDQADARCDVTLAAQDDSLALLARYDAVAEPRAWQWDPLGLRELSWLHEHGTLGSDYAKEHQLLESLQVLYRGDAQWPEFYVMRGKRKRLLSVQRARYQADEGGGGGEEEKERHWYYVNALYYSDRKQEVVAFFYLNLQENRLLLIPPH